MASNRVCLSLSSVLRKRRGKTQAKASGRPVRLYSETGRPLLTSASACRATCPITNQRPSKPPCVLAAVKFAHSSPMPEQPDIDPASECDIDYSPPAPRFDPLPGNEDAPNVRVAFPPKAKQRGLGFDGEVLKETIVRKLREANRDDLAHPLAKCHTERFVRLCNGCYQTKVFYNRCDLKHCPVCSKRLAYERRRSVEWWTKQVKQPKHVVLTARNAATIDAAKVRSFKAAFARLRRTKFARNWIGGFYSIEVTNEGKGWHIHLHALIEAKWIDANELASVWAKCIGQDFAIVKVKDARNGDYLRELCKYVCKGDQLAGWIPDDIAALIDSLATNRTFGAFGELYKMRALHREFLDGLQAEGPTCPCGCSSFRFFDKNEWEWFEATSGPNAPPEPQIAPKIASHPELVL